MFIEFQLLDQPGMALHLIEQELDRWGKRYNIPYTSKTVKYTHRVCFEEDKLYDFFVMSWNPRGINYLNRYVVVSDRNNRQ
jgi:hypothetical protein